MVTSLNSRIADAIANAVRALDGGELFPDIEVRPADRPEFGDFASNIALVAAKGMGRAPRELAAELADELLRRDEAGTFAKIDVAGPGFLNLFLNPQAIQAALHRILEAGDGHGRSPTGKGKRLQVEFVSSNPTGPLTVGHGRQAVLGDVLATLYERLGYDVHREYYFNDEGRQVDLLAESLWVRYRELFGESREIPEGGYQGDYLKDLAESLRREFDEAFPDFNEETQEHFRREAVGRMTQCIKEDLAHLGIRFDTWFSEADLHRDGEVEAALDALRSAGGVYERDGAVWLRVEDHGGAKDSVLIRTDGRPTYLMVDIAYHINKHRRGFDRVINVQGADHQVEQTCVKAAMRLLGRPEEFLDYAVHQFVSLKEGGEVQRMSTRAGRFATLRDLLADLGKDVVRFFMISRKPEAHLDFDLDLARSTAIDNPVAYIQYAHTRIVSIFRKAEDASQTAAVEDAEADLDLSPLTTADELELIKTLDRFPEIIENAAVSFAPHLLAEYAMNLSRSFHAYYDKHRILTDDENLSRARLALLRAIRLVLRQALEILGMEAPETM